MRRIAPEAAAAIVARLGVEGFFGRVRTVAVFVNEDPRRMAGILAGTGIDCAQIHGDETALECRNFTFPWYRALRVEPAGPGRAVLPGIAAYPCRRILLDAAVPGAYGGTGTTMDRTAAGAALGEARRSGKEVFIAGGIGPHNVYELVASLRPDGVDVGSAVEECPGRKSAVKLRSLFRELDRSDREEDGDGTGSR